MLAKLDSTKPSLSPPDPIVTFPALGLTAGGAASRFARMATPEPRKARVRSGTWSVGGDFDGRFRLVGGQRDYRLTFTRADRTWRIYQLPVETKIKAPPQSAQLD